jgi:pSer/pThr/pTyr-binding forkhead associated (FHA) protein
MARLVAIADGHANRVIELHLGVNQFGRSPNNEFRIEHSTVSAHHCQVVLAESGVVVRDCDSTNGTYVDGQRVTTAQLSAGQILR